jgi:hypothetical protein
MRCTAASAVPPRLRLLLSCHILLSVFAADAFAQCRVEGIVRTASGQPYAGITVQIDGGEYRKPIAVTASDDGRFVFEDVKPGTRVRVQAIVQGRAIAVGWTLVTKPVETVDLTEAAVLVSPNSAAYLLVADGPSGEIVGYVRSPDGSPANASITINETTVGTMTDGAGRYAIGGLRSGISVDVRVSSPGFEAASQKVQVPDGSQAHLNFSLTPVSRSQTTPEAIAPLAIVSPSAGDGTIAVRAEQLAAMPAASRNDVVRAFQFLPAVAATVDAALPLLVRGSPPGQTRVTIDGITLYQAADLSSGPVAFNTDAVRSAEFSKSPFGPFDGGHLAGTLRLSGMPASDRPTGVVNLSALGGAAQLQVPIGRWLTAAVAARGAPPSGLYTGTLERFAPRIGEPVRVRTPRFAGGALADAPTEPSYRDVHARFDVRPSGRDRISVSLYDGENEADLSYDQPLPAPAVGQLAVPEDVGLSADAAIEASRVRRWTGQGWSGTWRRGWSPTASSTFTLARSEYASSGSQAWMVTSPGTGEDYSYLGARGGSSALAESNDVNETTFRAENAMAAGFAHALSFGAAVSSYEIGYTARTEAAIASGDAGTSTLVDLLRQSERGRVITVFVHDSWRPVSRLIVAPAARIVQHGLAEATYVEPRVTASYQVRPDLRLTAGWSVDHEAVNRVIREDRAHGDGGFWALADGAAIPVPRAQQAVAGLNVSRPEVSFDLAGFYKRFDDLTVLAPRLFTGIAPDSGAGLHHGSGTAAGIEAIVQHRTPRNALWIGYTLGRVDQSFPTLEADTFPATDDQLHEFKVVNAYAIAPRWSVSGAFVAGSGRPYTAASGVETVWFPTGAVVSQLKFGKKNGSRLPVYHRLDLATERGFVVGRIGMSLGATVFNVYDQKSTVAEDYDSIAGTLAAHDVLQMGRAFNTFLRVRF